MQFIYVLCGVFGGKVMLKVSKGVKNQFLDLKLLWCGLVLMIYF